MQQNKGGLILQNLTLEGNYRQALNDKALDT
jgi:hypothetical protein